MGLGQALLYVVLIHFLNFIMYDHLHIHGFSDAKRVGHWALSKLSMFSGLGQVYCGVTHTPYNGPICSVRFSGV